MTPKGFFDKVVEMRRCQKEYFKNKRQIDLRISKQIEREVDEEIERVQKDYAQAHQAMKDVQKILDNGGRLVYSPKGSAGINKHEYVKIEMI